MSYESQVIPTFSNRLRRDSLRLSGPQQSKRTILGLVGVSSPTGVVGIRRAAGSVAGKSAVAAMAEFGDTIGGARRGGALGNITCVVTAAGKSAAGCETRRGGADGSDFVSSTAAGKSAVGATVSAAGHVVTSPRNTRKRSGTLATGVAFGAVGSMHVLLLALAGVNSGTPPAGLLHELVMASAVTTLL